MSDAELWFRELGRPANYDYAPSMKLVKKYSFPACDAELYLQANGPGTFQRVVKAFPKNFTGRLPAVAVPFYFPEAMLGWELETGEPLPRYDGVSIMLDLVKRGYMTASADAAHLTYLKTDRDRRDFKRWHDFGAAMEAEHPEWSGIGKLTADTRLLVDSLAEDPRVDASRIGITGHSLGGKMAFYTGCLDSRIRVILASDFGMIWCRTNWCDPWYWGRKLDHLQALGMDHAGLLGCAAPKPFCVLAGQADNMETLVMMKRTPGYEPDDERLAIINHAQGHRPPPEYLRQGYDFLDRYLK